VSQHVLTTLMKRWRTSGKGRGLAGLPLQPVKSVNFGLKVEVRSCSQILIQMYEKMHFNQGMWHSGNAGAFHVASPGFDPLFLHPTFH
jgi:hypothetical protein